MLKGFDDEIVLIFTEQILHGVKYLHKQELLHGNLKCDNIFLSELLSIKLGDVGECLIKTNNGDTKLVEEKRGPESLVAPEVKNGGKYDSTSDVWSIGVTILEMKLGKLPLKLNDGQQTTAIIADYKSEVGFNDTIQRILKSSMIERGNIESLLELCSPKNCCKSCPFGGGSSKLNDAQSFYKEIEGSADIEENVIPSTSGARQPELQDIEENVTPSTSDARQPDQQRNAQRYLNSFGNFGETYCSHNHENHEAQKIIKTSCIDTRRRLRELCISFQKNNIYHDHITQYYRYKSTRTGFHIYTEFAEFGSLADLYTANGGFIDQQVGFYIKQVLLGLQYLHGMGIIHGAIKCSNILLTERNKVKLSDYGLARVLMVDTENITFKSDIKSIGDTVLEMKFAKPCDSNDMNFSKPDTPEEISGEIKEFVEKCRDDEINDESIEKLLDHPLLSTQTLNETEKQQFLEDMIDFIKGVNQFSCQKRRHLKLFLEKAVKCDCFRYTTIVFFPLFAFVLLIVLPFSLILFLTDIPHVKLIISASVFGGVAGFAGLLLIILILVVKCRHINKLKKIQAGSTENVTKCLQAMSKIKNRLHFYLTEIGCSSLPIDLIHSKFEFNHHVLNVELIRSNYYSSSVFTQFENVLKSEGKFFYKIANDEIEESFCKVWCCDCCKDNRLTSAYFRNNSESMLVTADNLHRHMEVLEKVYNLLLTVKEKLAAESVK